MTMFIRLEDGAPVEHPVTEQNFRQLFPSVSFPKYYKPESVESFGYGIYDYSGPPEVSGYQKVVEVTPVKNEMGIWVQTWQVSDMTGEEQVEHDAKTAIFVRGQRNHRLTTSDWTQAADAPVDKAVWATYRQALRDIPDHANFPTLTETDWPTKPE
jgi:hypothetical protein